MEETESGKGKRPAKTDSTWARLDGVLTTVQIAAEALDERTADVVYTASTDAFWLFLDGIHAQLTNAAREVTEIMSTL